MTSGHRISQKHVSHQWRTTCVIFPRDMTEPRACSQCQSPASTKLSCSKTFFTAGLHMPLHPVLVDILCKFHVQFHQLTPNAIVQIIKFIWIVTSYRCRPTADVFAHHYELHYQNKKDHLEGCVTTLTVQFGCIAFHPTRYGGERGIPPP
jgi:hypothetical protein